MTEAEWLSSRDWHAMLLHLRRRKGVARTASGRRRLRLLACGCCRREWDRLLHRGTRNALEAGERYADGLTDEDGRAAAEETARRAVHEIEAPPVLFQAVHNRPLDEAESFRSYFAALAVMDALDNEPIQSVVEHTLSRLGYGVNALGSQEHEKWMEDMADLVREVFGNPFHPSRLKRSWRTATAVELARGIYLERAFDRMPILADALEDAGCDSAPILDHCRGGGTHTLGCWVLDAILGKK